MKFPSKQLNNIYQDYQEESLYHRLFKHKDILKLINKLKNESLVDIEKIGESFEERDIFSIKLGKGDTKIVAWSQMHGDEPTATMAIFDLLNFFIAEDELDDLKDLLLDKLTIYFIPMLNPDGAERFQRRNAMEIDLNRDAKLIQAPESKVLKKIIDEIQPEFGFNMHDQDIRWSVGKTGKSAAIAFLAPPPNYEKEVNDIRKRAMQVISDVVEEMNSYIPGHIAKFNDDFEERGFGDNIAKWGTSVILFESGRYKEDWNKDYIRRLNFIEILKALFSIATQSYKDTKLKNYDDLPFNGELMFDLLLKGLTYNYKGTNLKVDLGINREPVYINGRLYFKSRLEDFGDLSVTSGYEEVDCSGMELHLGKILDEEYEQAEDMSKKDFKAFLNEGVTHLICPKFQYDHEYVELPINIVKDKVDFEPELKYEKPANFYITKNDKLTYTVVNGYLYKPFGDTKKITNGLFF